MKISVERGGLVPRADRPAIDAATEEEIRARAIKCRRDASGAGIMRCSRSSNGEAMPNPWILNSVLHHILKSFNVFDDERAAAPLDDAKLRKTVDFTRHGFTMRTNAARNFGMCRRGINFD